MDYARAPLADALASAYVTGTLRGPARRRFESLLPGHPALRAAVRQWEDRLMPLAAVVPPVQPSAQVWRSLQARLLPAKAPASRSWWWQLWAGFATAGVLILTVQRLQPLPEAPAQLPVVVVLAPSGAAGDPLATQARFVASVSGDGRGLVLRPVDAVAVSAERALELWAVPAQGAPRSLGLIDQVKGAQVLKAQLLSDTAAFAVSIEPTGGSPTGAPTGTIISVGKLGA